MSAEDVASFVSDYAGELWLGVDLGTQSVKVSIVDRRGRVAGAASAPLTSAREARVDGTRHEQKPAQWISGARDAMAAAIAGLTGGDRMRVAGVAICATSGTITTVDAAGRALSAGIMYDDARAGELSDEVAAADPQLWSRLGYRIQPTWALPKILWLSRSALIAPGARIAHQADVVGAAITGGPVPSDWSHALKSGYDLLGLEWPANALSALGLDPRILPEVVAPGSLLGVSSEAWAETTGLPAGTPLYAGMTDGCAAQLGAATLGLGDWHSVIGTTLVVKSVSDRIVRDDAGAVYSHRAPHDGLWFPGGASSVGAGALGVVLPDADIAELTRRVADRYDGRLGDIPLAYPLTGRGERFPVVRPDASGLVVVDGLELPFAEASGVLDAEGLLASIFLGVAFVERLCVDTMRASGAPVTGTVSSSGGGSRNPWWLQLRADVLGRPISVPVSAEGSVGMAILAAWASDQRQSLPGTATAMSPVGAVVEPVAMRQAELEERYGMFRSLLHDRGWIAA
jgi:sugar (pentulose or hexulose) kinase